MSMHMSAACCVTMVERLAFVGCASTVTFTPSEAPSATAVIVDAFASMAATEVLLVVSAALLLLSVLVLVLVLLSVFGLRNVIESRSDPGSAERTIQLIGTPYIIASCSLTSVSL